MQSQFVLLTAAKNEECFIERAIRSVARQSCRPAAWFIVDDGSVDATAQIVADYSYTHSFIHLISRDGEARRSFGAQYRAINHAYERARLLEFEFVGIVDADIEFEDDRYYERVLQRFFRDDRVGVAGGYINEQSNGVWLPRVANSIDSVAGGIQLFRRACFEQIGGYTPLLFGGEDWLAQIEARRLGWGVQVLPELVVRHYRPASSADGRIRGLFRLGMMDGSFGSHPIFEIFKCVRRMEERPVVFGSFVRLGGYLWWWATRRAALLQAEKCRYLRNEQISKLQDLFSHIIARWSR